MACIEGWGVDWVNGREDVVFVLHSSGEVRDGYSFWWRVAVRRGDFGGAWEHGSMGRWRKGSLMLRTEIWKVAFLVFSLGVSSGFFCESVSSSYSGHDG